MAHYRTCITAPGSADAVFDYMADFSNAARWDPTVTRASRLTPTPLGVGSRFELYLGSPVGDLRFEYSITRFEPSHVLAFEAETALLRSLDTIEIEPSADGCRVYYDADLRPRGPGYLFDLPIHLAFQFSGARSARGLERALCEIRN